MKRLALLLAIILLPAQASESNSPITINLFSWASAGMSVSFPQTYVLDKNSGEVFSKLSFGSSDEFLKAWSSQQVESELNIDTLKDQFPKLHSAVTSAWKTNERVIITVAVNKSVTDCKPCNLQTDLMEDQNYFGLPNIEVVLTK